MCSEKSAVSIGFLGMCENALIWHLDTPILVQTPVSMWVCLERVQLKLVVSHYCSNYICHFDPFCWYSANHILRHTQWCPLSIGRIPALSLAKLYLIVILRKNPTFTRWANKPTIWVAGTLRQRARWLQLKEREASEAKAVQRVVPAGCRGA